MITIRQYTSIDKPLWDGFVALSKNATFLHYRDYMDYHSDRFHDFSLMAFDGGRLLALLPANLSGDTLYSHQGLTFGGWLMPLKHFNANTMLEVFDAMVAFLRDNGIRRLVYKAIPHIYHKYPAEEDLYALFRHNARILVTNMSSTVMSCKDIPFDRRTRRNVAKALQNGVVIGPSDDYPAFWRIITANLDNRYSAKPVHSLSEIELLHSRFPKNIKLYSASLDGRMVAGAVMYEEKDWVHAQYSSADETGFSIGAMNYLFYHLITEEYKEKSCFDFGTSNENDGLYLNANLIETKTGLGARGVAYNIYEMTI